MFLDAIELRAAVGGSCRFLGTGARAPSKKLNIEVETDPLDVDALAQREKVVRLARRVLWDGMVRRTA
ncbi:MAG TPA: hypothetical protein VG674_25470 [Amycolatopsis sp.]|nr:hypothetical protein [Amycolatopsis sp.]